MCCVWGDDGWGVSGPRGSGSPLVSAGEKYNCVEGKTLRTAADPPHRLRVGDLLARTPVEPLLCYAVCVNVNDDGSDVKTTDD